MHTTNIFYLDLILSFKVKRFLRNIARTITQYSLFIPTLNLYHRYIVYNLAQPYQNVWPWHFFHFKVNLEKTYSFICWIYFDRRTLNFKQKTIIIHWDILLLSIWSWPFLYSKSNKEKIKFCLDHNLYILWLNYFKLRT